jgi:hypothetical protein
MDKDSLLAQFQAITNTGIDQAKFYLESAQWDLNVRVSPFPPPPSITFVNCLHSFSSFAALDYWNGLLYFVVLLLDFFMFSSFY